MGDGRVWQSAMNPDRRAQEPGFTVTKCVIWVDKSRLVLSFPSFSPPNWNWGLALCTLIKR